MVGPMMFFAIIAFTLVLSAAFATWLVRGFHTWWVERQPNLPFACYALGMILVVSPRSLRPLQWSSPPERLSCDRPGPRYSSARRLVLA